VATRRSSGRGHTKPVQPDMELRKYKLKFHPSIGEFSH